MTQKLPFVGVSFISPLAVLLLVNGSSDRFDTLLIDQATKPKELEQHIAVQSDGKRLRVAVLASIDVLLSDTLRDGISRFDRVVVVDVPSTLASIGIDPINVTYAGGGMWPMRKINYQEMAARLEMPQDLRAALATKIDLPHRRRTVRVESGHLHVALAALIADTDSVDQGDLDKMVSATLGYVIGSTERSDFAKTSGDFIRRGGNASITGALTKYLKTNRAILNRALAVAYAGNINYRHIAEHFDPTGADLLLQELAYVRSLMLDTPQAVGNSTVPKALRRFIGSGDTQPTFDQTRAAPEDTVTVNGIEIEAGLFRAMNRWLGRPPVSVDPGRLVGLREAMEGRRRG